MLLSVSVCLLITESCHKSGPQSVPQNPISTSGSQNMYIPFTHRENIVLINERSIELSRRNLLHMVSEDKERNAKRICSNKNKNTERGCSLPAVPRRNAAKILFSNDKMNLVFRGKSLFCFKCSYLPTYHDSLKQDKWASWEQGSGHVHVAGFLKNQSPLSFFRKNVRLYITRDVRYCPYYYHTYDYYYKYV